MAKKAYIGVNGVARKVKAGYIGVDGVARKIKKAYIGIGGVARPCWSGGQVTYYGTVSSLSVARSKIAGASVGNYAIFAGGEYYDSNYDRRMCDTVDAYNESLTHRTLTRLQQARSYMASTSNNTNALFTGGITGLDGDAFYSSNVDAYNASLTRTIPADLQLSRIDHAGACIGTFAVFAGGYVINNGNYYSTDALDAYSEQLVKTTPNTLSVARKNLAAARVGNYALFAGGNNQYSVDAFNDSLVRTTINELFADTRYAHYLCGASIGNNAIFLVYDCIDIYDASLTHRYIDGYATARHQGRVSVELDDFALFADDTDNGSKEIEVVDTSLTYSLLDGLSIQRAGMAAAAAGKYAIFAGGECADYISDGDEIIETAWSDDTVDVFTVI